MLRMIPLLLLVIFATFALAATARAGEVVRTPRLVSERVVDCSTVESIITAIIKPGMTQRAKAEAVYEFVRNYRYHWAPAREGARRDDFEYGIVYDPVKFINVYGYGYCFQCAPVLEALYQAAGLEARCGGIGGHVIAEVFYDGAYHFYDADQQGYCLMPDGKTVASVDQLSRDPIRLVLNQPNPSNPFFPATRNPLVPYESKVLATAYLASRGNNYARHDKIDVGHRMDISLAPGMRYTRYFEPKGQWSYRYSEVADDCKVGYIDPAVGPRDHLSDKSYGNGSLLWQPDLTSATNEYRLGVWRDENMAQDEHGLTPARAGKPALAVFRVRVPYVIVGWPTAWTGPPKPVGAAVVSANFTRANAGCTQAISVSADSGRTWTTVWKNGRIGASQAVVDLSQQVEGGYEYLVRFEQSAKAAPADSRIEQLAMLTNFQLNPSTLPAVGPGRTKMRFALGEQTETAKLTADLSTMDAIRREAASVSDIQLTKPNHITSAAGKTGEIVYLLQPPQPGTVRRFSVEAGCRREPGEFNYLDDVKIYYAENEPKEWKLLCDDDVPPYAEHWSYYLTNQARCSANVGRVFVKFALHTENSAAIRMIRLRTHWQPEGEAGGERAMPVRGVRIEHCWAEGDVEKKFETVVKDAPTRYVVEAGKDVANKWVTIEPVRDPRCAWRPDDPPVKRPVVAPMDLTDPALRGPMQAAVKAIDANPAKALPEAAASKIVWLAGGAREAIEMYRTSYPLADKPTFGLATLAEAGRLAKLAGPPAAGDADKLADALAAVQGQGRDSGAAGGASTRPDTDRQGARGNRNKGGDEPPAATDPDTQRACLAAALVLLDDARGRPALVKAIVGVNKAAPGTGLEPMVVLLRADDQAGRKAVGAVLAGPDMYLKLRLIDMIAAAKVRPAPDELLAGLTDSSRWVRLASLELFRGSASPAARRAVGKMAKADALDFLRAEAASVLATMKEDAK